MEGKNISLYLETINVEIGKESNGYGRKSSKLLLAVLYRNVLLLWRLCWVLLCLSFRNFFPLVCCTVSFVGCLVVLVHFLNRFSLASLPLTFSTMVISLSFIPLPLPFFMLKWLTVDYWLFIYIISSIKSHDVRRTCH